MFEHLALCYFCFGTSQIFRIYTLTFNSLYDYYYNKVPKLPYQKQISTHIVILKTPSSQTQTQRWLMQWQKYGLTKCNLIANLFPALPAIPTHIRLKLNKFNIRRELSSLLVSLHLVIIWLWSDQINPVSPLPSDFPTLRISFGQPDNPQSCCLHQRSMLTHLFHTLYVFQKIRRDWRVET